MQLSTKTLLALLPFFLQQANAGASGTGTTTRYWDCCKPSCSWPGKASLLAGSNPVTTCDISDNPLTDYNAVNGCGGGNAYMCSNESPWAVSDDLAYGYAAVNIAGGSESSWCCACYELTFTSGTAAGKKMIVQATNTGGDLAGNQFDISMPGGGVGIFNGCTAEWGAPSSGWGAQYGGISDRSACDSFPEALKAGCYWRFDWFAGCDNPTVSFKQVACPAAITKKSGCTRADDASMAAPDADTGAAVVASSSTPAVVVASSKAAAVVVAESSTPVAVVATKAAAAVVSSADAVATPDAPVAAADPIATSAASVETTAPVVVVASSATFKKPATKLTVAPGNPSATHNHKAHHTHKAHHHHEEDDVCEA